MARQVFNPPLPPQPGTGEQVNFRQLRAQFGDGYSQRGGDGLNADLADPVTLQWSAMTPDQAAAVIDFMKQHKDGAAFDYTLPGEAIPRVFSVLGFARTDGPNSDGLTVTLREEADL